MSFYTDVIAKDRRFNSTATCKDLALLEPGTRAAVLAIIADAKAQGVEFRVLETYRSQARQHALFEQRLTQLSKVGCHGFGVACDLAMFENGKYVSDGSKYGLLWTLAKKHKMISGEDWGHGKPSAGFRDPDHIQRIPVWRQNEMFAGKFYPPVVYDPYADKAPALAA